MKEVIVKEENKRFSEILKNDMNLSQSKTI